ncbi:hypothetical protein [Actinomadura violacea]|uniref:Uncharacterized protein n=1 Tax=Actinomadura violacea TaxID=2819934 RepID=A0ABS3RSW7_9ACTN|nr:hypothetical protein [Actinomadura violacea]MBO2459856.1 hypothetical protein [Actinomadura violacea]
MPRVDAQNNGAPKPPYTTRTLLITVLMLVTGGVVGLGAGISAAVAAVQVSGVGFAAAAVIGGVFGAGAGIMAALKAAVALNQLVGDKSA